MAAIENILTASDNFRKINPVRLIEEVSIATFLRILFPKNFELKYIFVGYTHTKTGRNDDQKYKH